MKVDRVRQWIAKDRTMKVDDVDENDVTQMQTRVAGNGYEFGHNITINVLIDHENGWVMLISDIEITDTLAEHIEETSMEHVTIGIQPLLTDEEFYTIEDGDAFRITKTVYELKEGNVMKSLKMLARRTYLALDQIDRHEKAQENNGDEYDPDRPNYSFA